MKTLLVLFLLIPSLSMSLTFKDGKQVKEKKYGEVVYCINNSSKKVLKSRSGLCPKKYRISSKKAYLHYLSTKNEITIDINTENYKPVVWCKNPTNGYIRKMSSCPIGDFTEQSSRDEYLQTFKQKKQKNLKKDTSNKSNTKLVKSNTSNQTNTSKSSGNNTSVVSNIIDKDELKEQLKYWKSLLDDELISQKDYDYKKDILLNSLGSEKKVLKTTNSNNSNSANSNTASNNNLESDLDNLMNTSNSNSNTSSSKSKCAGLNADKSWVYKGLTGFFSKKDACLKIASYSDDRLCSKIKKGKDDILNPESTWYQKEISSRGMTCIDGVAFDKSDSSTKTLQAIQKLEDKIDNQPKYREVCRYENVLGERLDGSTYPKRIKSCRNVKIKSNEDIMNEAVGSAIMSIFD